MLLFLPCNKQTNILLTPLSPLPVLLLSLFSSEANYLNLLFLFTTIFDSSLKPTLTQISVHTLPCLLSQHLCWPAGQFSVLLSFDLSRSDPAITLPALLTVFTWQLGPHTFWAPLLPHCLLLLFPLLVPLLLTVWDWSALKCSSQTSSLTALTPLAIPVHLKVLTCHIYALSSQMRTTSPGLSPELLTQTLNLPWMFNWHLNLSMFKNMYGCNPHPDALHFSSSLLSWCWFHTSS